MGDRVAGREPGRRVEVESLDEARGSGTQLAGERGQDLEPRGGHDRSEPELRGRPGHAGEEERLGLVRGEPGQPRPVAVDQLDPAVRTALRVDRDARGAERVDVAVDRALADLELGRQHGGRRPAARLEEQEQLDEPRRAHGCREYARIGDRIGQVFARRKASASSSASSRTGSTPWPTPG